MPPQQLGVKDPLELDGWCGPLAAEAYQEGTRGGMFSKREAVKRIQDQGEGGAVPLCVQDFVGGGRVLDDGAEELVAVCKGGAKGMDTPPLTPAHKGKPASLVRATILGIELVAENADSLVRKVAATSGLPESLQQISGPGGSRDRAANSPISQFSADGRIGMGISHARLSSAGYQIWDGHAGVRSVAVAWSCWRRRRIFGITPHGGFIKAFSVVHGSVKAL
ncbi:hypothetical protein HDU96_010677 [Phlyctochytrium bullatum]|nr:hypothetical protein HDU96_010677 [Phlyctochytrium bullatum]